MRLGFIKARASHHPVGKGFIDTADNNTTDSIRPEHTASPTKENKEHYFKVLWESWKGGVVPQGG